MIPGRDAIAAVHQEAMPVDETSAAERLLTMIDSSATVVLIGEATHGTREFYRIRADLTRLLSANAGSTSWRLKRTGPTPTA